MSYTHEKKDLCEGSLATASVELSDLSPLTPENVSSVKMHSKNALYVLQCFQKVHF